MTEAELIVRDRRASAVPEPAPVAVPALPTVAAGAAPLDVIAALVARGFEPERIEAFIALQERHEKREAEKAFAAAMAAFKANPPTITKNKLVRVPHKNGGGVTEYRHATHDEVTNKIAAALGVHGLSHRFQVEQIEGGQIRVTCILQHALGHSEQISLSNSRDDSGSKNNLQSMGSTLTYLQRYLLLSITGLSTADLGDDDGRHGGDAPGAEPEEVPEVPVDVKTAISEAKTFDEISEIWRQLSEGTRVLILKHHRVWWESHKVRTRGQATETAK